jgi:hypothetical protein
MPSESFNLWPQHFKHEAPTMTPESVNGSSERRTQQEPPQKSALVKDDITMILLLPGWKA